MVRGLVDVIRRQFEFTPRFSISSDPENLEAINLLAGMGILTDDDGLVDAALSEMLSLPLDQRAAMDPHHDVNGLLVKHHLGQVSNARLCFCVCFKMDLFFPGRHPQGVLGNPKGDLCSTHVEGVENPGRIPGVTKRSRRPGHRSAGFR